MDGVERITSALHVGREPEYWSVYAQHENETSQWLADFPTQQEAEALELRVAGVDAHAETNEFDQAQKLARINERTVRADPASTDEQISAPKRRVRAAGTSAPALHEKYPDKPVIIAGDNDAHLVLTLGVNPGKEKALEAAQATGGTAVFPIFAAGEQSYSAGLPAVTPALTVRALLSDEQKAAIGKMKQFTDFNDLATKSALGKEAIGRQLGTIVKAAIEARQPQQQERVQQLQQRPQRAGMSV